MGLNLGLKVRLSLMGPASTNNHPWKRHKEAQTHGGDPGEAGGGWRDSARAREHEGHRELDRPLELLEGSGPGTTDGRPLASRLWGSLLLL